MVTEGVLLPSTLYTPEAQLHVDPFLTTFESEALRDLREGITYLLFSTLFKENTSGTLDFDLVTEVSYPNDQNDGANYIISIRSDVYWHNGEKLDTDDVIFTFRTLEALGGASGYTGAINGNEIKYEKIDDYTFSIYLGNDDEAKPNSAYLYELTFPILPAHILSDYPNTKLKELADTEFGSKPVGSGIFRFESNKDAELTLKTNDLYYGKKPKFEKFRVKLYENYDDIIKDFKLRNLDLFTRKDFVVSDEVHTRLMDTSGVKTFDTVLKNVRLVLYFNLRDSVSQINNSFTLRSGLRNVIDRNKLIEAVGGKGKIIWGPINEESWAFKPGMITSQSVNKEEYLNKATELGLSKKGNYLEKDGQKVTIKLTYLENNYRSVLAEVLKTELESVGIKVVLDAISTEASGLSINSAESNTKYLQVINNRNFEAILTSVTHYQDPDRFAEWHSSAIPSPGLNLSSFGENASDLALEEGRVNVSQEERKKNYDKFQELFLEFAPAMYLLSPSVTTYYSQKISNVEISEINDIRYKYKNIADWDIK